jgi:hypothetical protein
MLSESDRRFIYERAHVPEHLPDYVSSVTGAEAHLYGGHVLYVRDGTLVLVGYPLDQPFEKEKLGDLLELAVKKFHSKTVSLLAPSIPPWRKPSSEVTEDFYYRLELEHLNLSGKLRNMITRASRELTCDHGRELHEEHLQLIQEFSKRPDLEDASRLIFSKVPDYVSHASSSLVWSAKDEQGNLVAFTVAEYGARDCGFYMFHFRAMDRAVPGASDLLLREAIREAVRQGKRYMNLGLGMNRGVAFFKKKWGATPFLPYATCSYTFTRPLLFRALGI